MEEKAKQLLEEMTAQEAHYIEQLQYTRGAIQILQVLLADSDKENDNETIQSNDED